MKIVLLRHAARSSHDFGHEIGHEFGDTPLNAIGRAQAEALRDAIAPQGPLPQPTHLITSPKKRAKETLLPLSESTHVTLTIDARLDERHQNETMREFETRVRDVIGEFVAPERSAPRETCLYLATHLDWLEAALIAIPSDLSSNELDANWTNCEYRIFRIHEGLWSLAGKGVITGR